MTQHNINQSETPKTANTITAIEREAFMQNRKSGVVAIKSQTTAGAAKLAGLPGTEI